MESQKFTGKCGKITLCCLFYIFFLILLLQLLFLLQNLNIANYFRRLLKSNISADFYFIWKIINIDMSILKIIGDLRELSILMVIKSTRKTIQKLLRKKFLLLTPT